MSSGKHNTETNKIRDSYSWLEKSKIRVKVKYLCKVCVKDIDYKYTYDELDVNYNIPISEDYSKRLDSDNLITLCRYHHALVETK